MRVLALSLVVVVASACVAVEFTAMNKPPWPLSPKTVAAVEVLFEKPSRPHVVVGIIDATDQTGSVTRSRYMEAMRKTAAEHGCDGIVVGPTEAPLGYAQGAAYCIVYKQSPAPASMPGAARRPAPGKP